MLLYVYVFLFALFYLCVIIGGVGEATI